MVNQKIEVEVNIVDEDKVEKKMTELLISLIKLRLSKYPQSSQPVIYDMTVDKMNFKYSHSNR